MRVCACVHMCVSMCVGMCVKTFSPKATYVKPVNFFNQVLLVSSYFISLIANMHGLTNKYIMSPVEDDVVSDIYVLSSKTFFRPNKVKKSFWSSCLVNFLPSENTQTYKYKQ